jgi:hypothetical protein
MPVSINGNGSVVGVTSVTGAGMDLIVPTSVAGAGVTLSGGQISFTTATSVSVNGVFSSTYDNYRIITRLIGSTTALPSIRLRLSGTDASGANYEHQYLQASAATVSAARTTGSTGFEIASIGSTDYSYLIIDIGNPSIASTTQLSINSNQYTSASIAGQYAGRHSLTTAYDGFSLLANTGSTTGIIRVYGLRKS